MTETVPISIDDQVEAARREVRQRERVYPRFIANGKMTQAAADREVARMKAIVKTLEDVAAAGRLL
jgi:hypothetical protein